MKSISHYFSNNVANRKKSYFDGVWFSVKKEGQNSNFISCPLKVLFLVIAVHRGKYNDSNPILHISSCLR